MHWRDLEVWKKAHALVLEIYKLTDKFPPNEKYGLTDQLRRASYSVTANLVDGQSRNTTHKGVSLFSVKGQKLGSGLHI